MMCEKIHLPFELRIVLKKAISYSDFFNLQSIYFKKYTCMFLTITNMMYERIHNFCTFFENYPQLILEFMLKIIFFYCTFLRIGFRLRFIVITFSFIDGFNLDLYKTNMLDDLGLYMTLTDKWIPLPKQKKGHGIAPAMQ